MRILLVEDDALLGQALHTGLSRAGYSVDWVTDGDMALEAVEAQAFNAVALDINLPKRSGLQVLKDMRSSLDVPVVIMTARDAVDDRVRGLDLGADDYLVKPFDMVELLARLRAVIRRYSGRTSSRVVCGDLVLDTADKSLHKDGEPIRLTQREYQLLTILMGRAGRIQSRADIEAQIYSWDDEVESNAVEVTIYGLRKKLGKLAIQNIRGVGYVMTTPRPCSETI